MRDGVEDPDELAGEDVVGAEVAERGAVAFAGRGAEQDEILEDASGGAGWAALAAVAIADRGDRRGRRCRRC